MKNDMDTQIKNELIKHTNINQEEKDQIWRNINNQINGRMNTARMKKQRRSYKGKLFIAFAAAILLLIATQSKMGHAVINQMKIIFEPEKEIIQLIEGTNEEETVNLHEGSEADYVIYIDEERYTFIKSDRYDQVIAKNHPENYPDVGMDIQQFPEKEPEEVLKELRANWINEPFDISEIRQVDYPFDALSFRVKKGNEADSEMIRYLAISNGKNGSFVFKQYFFLEAEEGHGARLNQMLKEFHLVEKEK
ncbi:hypothetical protein J2Z40_000226 [Cytobacillus eiseniae]|uniref:DUF4367 domain-containing protein n=1 Tax=Cytobacillus eiseniae TaxID=762947 RepID=A0ABS4R9U8_9BACI|nr:hypothetical protein [Cytobacillus eiseniae]MBP2239673.1 hypothetical protein [Cytobacillus eiseniae]